MASDRTRLFVLLGALGAAALVAVRLAVSEPGSTQTPERTPRGADTNHPDATTLERVQLEALSESRPDPAETRRNPFRFGSTRGDAGAPASAGFLSGPGPAPVSTFMPPPLPAGPPPPPPIPLKFIGIVERGPGLRLAVLSDGRNVFYGREGEILEGRYRIERIGPESIDLAWADGRGRQTIRLSGS